MGSALNNLDLPDIGLKGSVGLPVGMGNILTESDALSTELALCHSGDTSIYSKHGKHLLWIV